MNGQQDTRVPAGGAEAGSWPGQMGRRIREHDWSASELGPIESWPRSLFTVLGIALSSRFPILVWWGPRLRAIYNDAYIPIFGAKHPGVLGNTGVETWGEVWDIIGPMLENVMAGGGATWSEDQLLLLRRFGFTEETYFTWSYSPIPDDAGRTGGVLTTVFETTKRVVSERRLGTLRELGTRASAAASADDACSSAVEILGHNAADVPFALIYLPESEDRLGLKGAVRRGEDFAPESIRQGDDAPWPVFEVMATNKAVRMTGLSRRLPGLSGGQWPEPADQALLLPIASPDRGRPAGVLVAGISPRLLLDDDYSAFLELVVGHLSTALATASAYERAKQRAEALAELDRAKSTFFSNVSHEFRTPLTLLLGPLEDLLRRDDTSLAGSREQLQLMHRNGLRLLRLVNALLDFSRMEGGRVRPSPEPTDLARFTADLSSAFAAAMQRGGLRYVVECPPLPRSVAIDRGMWEKIVFNLISNAFKFTTEGEVRVSLSAEAEGPLLEVADTGAGIPHEEISKIFERFHRVESVHARTHEGTGIGLALTRELILLQGGSIDVQSEPGQGTRFRVRVPWGEAGEPRPMSPPAERGQAYFDLALSSLSDRAPRDAAPPAPVGEPGERARVLLAEDNADMRAYIVRLLGPHHDVTTAPDGQAAIEHLRAGSFDLVLSDVMMPRLDGHQLIQQMRADPHLRELPIILLSARAGEEARVEGLEGGADDYLIKPFSAPELIARVGAHARLSRMRRAIQNERALLLARETEARREAEALCEAALSLADGLDLQSIVQRATEIATELTGARFGSFFYRVDRAPEAGFELFTLAGAPREAFEKLGRPRATQIFAPTFDGEGTVRIDDVLADPRYGKMAPHHGMPPEHLPVRSYLAVPVVSRGGRIHGGLFFGHPDAGVFTGRAERLALGIAHQTALALDNAGLYEDARHSAEGLALALSASRMGDWQWAADTDVLTLSPRAAVLFGIPSGSGMTWNALHALLHEEDRERARLAVEAAIRDFADYDVEYRLRRPDGKLVWIAARGRSTRDAQGRTTGMLGVVQDVSERKAAEEKLRDQQERLAAALAAGATGTFVWNVRTGALFWDDSLRLLFGLPSGSTVEDLNQFLALIHPDDRSKIIEACRRTVEAGADLDEDFRISLPDGTVRWLHDKGKLVRDAAGEVQYMAGACADITDRRLGEDVLRSQRDLLERIVRGGALPEVLEQIAESANAFCRRRSIAMVFQREPGGKYLRPSAGRGAPASLRQRFDPVPIGANGATFGVAAESLKPVFTASIADDPSWSAYRDEAAAHGLQSCWALPIFSSTRDVLGTIAVLRTEKTPPTAAETQVLDLLVRTAAIAIERDLADRARWDYTADLERGVAARTTTLLETIAELEAFSYSVSHDMRAPLRAMQGYASALFQDYGPKLDGEGRHWLERIARNAQRLEMLVRDVLTYSRVAKGEIALEAVELEAFVQDLISQNAHLQPPALELTFAGRMLPVLAHEAYLSQVLGNLLGNSVKFTRPGEPARVEISCTAQGAMVKVAVADQGIGIDASHFTRIFTIFGRVHPDSAYEGTGIGLSIVKKAVERMGGTVGVDSQLGKGSLFWFTLKRA